MKRLCLGLRGEAGKFGQDKGGKLFVLWEKKRLQSLVLSFLLIAGLVFPVGCKPGAKEAGEKQGVEVSEDTPLVDQSDSTADDSDLGVEPEILPDGFDPLIKDYSETERYQLLWPGDLSYFQAGKSPEAKLFQGLFFAAPLRQIRSEAGFSFVPELLAELPEFSEDGLEVILRFRNEPLAPGLEPVTATAYHDFLKQMLSAKRHNPLALEIINKLPLEGALEYYRGAIRNNYNPSELAAEAEELRADLLAYNQSRPESERLGHGFLTSAELSAEPEPEQDSAAEDNEAEDADGQAELDLPAEVDSELDQEADLDSETDSNEEAQNPDAEASEEAAEDAVSEQEESSPEAQREALIERLQAYLAKEAKNFGRGISQRVYEQLPEKRPLWASVGISLVEVNADPLEAELADSEPSGEQEEADAEALTEPEDIDEADLEEDQTELPSGKDYELHLRFTRAVNKLDIYHLLSQYGPLVYRAGLSEDSAKALLDGQIPAHDWRSISSSLETSYGPYTLAELSDQTIVLERRPEHLSASYSKPDHYLFRKFKTAEEMVEVFNQGGLDEYRYRGVFNLDRHHEHAKAFPGATWSVYFNRQPSPGREYLSTDNFRTALGLSLHRPYLVSSIIPHMQSTTTLFSESALDPFDWSLSYRDSLEAKGNVAPNDGLDMLAAEAAYTSLLNSYGLAKIDCSLIYPAGSEDLAKVAGELKTQWELFFKAERIELELIPLSLDELSIAMLSGQYDLALAPFEYDPFDPLAALESFTYLGFDNLTAYENSEFTALYNDMRQREGLLTEGEWRGGLARLEQMLLLDRSILPLFIADEYIVFSEQVDYAEKWIPAIEFRTN